MNDIPDFDQLVLKELFSNKKFMNFNELDINLCYSESRIGLCHLYLFIYLFKHG